MSRNAGGHLYAATPAAGQGTLLQADLALNLTQWTVGALKTFGAGGTERNYFVLTHPTAGGEVLVYCPNGLSSTVNSGIPATYRAGLNGEGGAFPLAFAYAPEGGFAAAFTAGQDPVNQSFWDHITVTQAKMQPSKVHMIDIWISGAAAQSTYWLEDTSREALTVYTGNTAANVGYGCVIIGRDLIVPREEEFGYGMIFVDVLATGPAPIDSNCYCTLWDGDETRKLVSGNGFEDQTVLTGLTGTNQPYADDSKYQTATLAVVQTDRIYGVVHEDYMRSFPQTTATWKTKRGDSAAFKFVHIFKNFLTPWDDALAAPA